MSFKERIDGLKQRIRSAAVQAGRDPESVCLVAVSKTVPAEKIRRAAENGATILGENYIQEAREKIAALSDLDISWHFIGHLQTNKAKYAVKMFDLIHTVDSVKLAVELNKQAKRIGKVQEVLIQINIAGESTKSGTDRRQAEDIVKEIERLPHLEAKGLMTIPPFFDDPDRARPYFAELRRLRDHLQQQGAEYLSELSMGMSGDFEAAIFEGATIVRVGTAIFGERQT